MSLRTRHIAAIVAIVLIAGTAFCAARQWFSVVTYSALQLLPLPKPVGRIQLETVQGEKFSQQDFMGKWTLVFFGYSHCKDICPMELQTLNQVLQQLNDKPVQAVFVGLDPQRDSIEKLAEFTALFNHKIIAVTGDTSTLVKATRFFGAAYNFESEGALENEGNHESEGAATNNLAVSSAAIASGANAVIDNETVIRSYELNHSNRIYLVSPQAEYLGSFPAPQNAEKIAADLQMIIKR